MPARPAVPAISKVFSAQEPRAIVEYREDAALSAKMVDQLVMAVTGRPTVAAAWRSLVSPKDRVGIKVSAAGAPFCISHPGVVEAIAAGLEQAGVPRTQIIIWDRDLEKLRAAGFDGRGRHAVRGLELPRDWDREAVFSAPVLGKLIWGDLLFREKLRRKDGRRAEDGDQLSSDSHLARILSREVTKVVNVPALSEVAGCGVGGALYNMTVPNVDNWRRFLQGDISGAESLAALYADERIAPKVVLTVMDALVAQYAGGPGSQPNYAFHHQTLYASLDPVAIDAVALRQLEAWRAQARLSPIGTRAGWLESAAQMGLGNFAPDKINLLPPGEPRR